MAKRKVKKVKKDATPQEFHHDISVTDLGKLKKRIDIRYDAEGVRRADNEASAAVGRQVQIKGFRKGAAPLALVKSHCGDQIKLATTSILSQKGYLHACNEHKLLVLSEPEFDDPKYNDDGSWSCSITVEVRPNIDPSGYVGLQLEKVAVDREQIFEQLEESLNQQFVVDRQVDAVEDRSMVTVDFEVFVDGDTVTSGVAQPFFITEAAPEPFGKNLLGKVVGDECVETTTLPKEYERHGGKEAEVRIQIKSIVKKTPPTREELVEKTNSPSYEELVDAIRQRAEVVSNQKEIAVLEEAAIDQLLDTHEFDVPETWVDAEKSYVLQQIGVEEAPDEQTGKFVEDMALRNVKRTFLLEAIYDEEPTLKLTEADVAAVLESEAKKHGVSTLIVKKEWQEKNMLDSVLSSIKHKKVLSFIVGGAQIISAQDPVVIEEVAEEASEEIKVEEE